jgi:hypothetical protein
MKINKTINLVAICCLLFYTHNIHTLLNDNFEEEFITKMNQVQKQFEAATNDMQSTLKEFHNQFFHDLPTRTKDFPMYDQPKNIINNQNSSNYYQQSTSSLTLNNKDKEIKITEAKDTKTTTYIIIVTHKKMNDITTETSNKQEFDTPTQLKELISYIQKAFQSKPADKILQECLNAMTEEHKDRIISIESSTNDNQQKYTIEIAHKKAIDTHMKTISKKQSRKNKKLANRS